MAEITRHYWQWLVVFLDEVFGRYEHATASILVRHIETTLIELVSLKTKEMRWKTQRIPVFGVVERLDEG